ncbi:MAG TPA: CaiB/BaiF CoA-transferase family protein [Acetobacteraceae bacterium]|jgi:CoA:oxalate CoA-transferase|nr:CaiB/BaiF CoA-transferase family protein [Acetobacteraceae bacterium]
MTKPFVGVRVLDLTNVIAGPLASYQLALLGAEVIKVEVPGVGDLARKMGADPDLGKRQMGASYLAMNAGKKSITLNLKAERGKEIFRALAGTADVVLENFRPGAMARLGLSAEALRTLNPRLIYCAVSGFGQTGPLAGRASYDQIIQGYAGLMSLTGDAQSAPQRAGLVVCDTTAAITAAFAIAAALFRRASTGEGEVIDVSMLDSSLATMTSWMISNHLNAGHVPKPLGNHSHTSAPSGTFRTKDGVINLVNNEQKQFTATCEALEMPELSHDPRFAERDHRMRNQVVLQQVLEARLATATSAEWEERLSAAGVPVGPVLSVPEIAQLAHLAARGVVHTVPVPALDRDVRVVGAGFQLGGAPVPIDAPPPTLGEHTEVILRGLGVDAAELEQLRANTVI